MKSDKNYFTMHCYCELCFLNWTEEAATPDRPELYVIKRCDFCQKGPSSFELLKRRLDAGEKVVNSPLCSTSFPTLNSTPKFKKFISTRVHSV